ncbi:UDP-N-acetylmuramate dehydrogenase [Patescibacteria group bacterium]|nr:UDP-N-acetylmuramate dehydrogenase [Patescibacteria group bacterium]
MLIKDHEPLGPKTTMRIGGTARYFADLETKQDVEEAYAFAQEKKVPLVVLGAGANTIFADGTINALVVRVKGDDIEIDGNSIRVQTGKNLAILINECAEDGLDLSALTGIPGTVGGAIVGNAGQGPKGTWLDSFVVNVTAFVDGEWKTFSKEECEFAYRESTFKRQSTINHQPSTIIWEAILNAPQGKPEEIKSTIQELLKKRMKAQPHAKTSGSCFKAANGTPAWELIEKAGLRDLKIGGVHISEKHANFLINEDGSFEDVAKIIEEVQTKVPELKEVEMRLIGEDGQPTT